MIEEPPPIVFAPSIERPSADIVERFRAPTELHRRRDERNRRPRLADQAACGQVVRRRRAHLRLRPARQSGVHGGARRIQARRRVHGRNQRLCRRRRDGRSLDVCRAQPRRRGLRHRRPRARPGRPRNRRPADFRHGRHAEFAAKARTRLGRPADRLRRRGGRLGRYRGRRPRRRRRRPARAHRRDAQESRARQSHGGGDAGARARRIERAAGRGSFAQANGQRRETARG